MKHTKIIYIFFSLFIIITSCTKKQNESKQKQALKVKILKNKVYTTAHYTDLKLTPTKSLVFSEAKQPLETQADIVVNPNKQFQTFLGIGGALTDASAETFFKLPEKVQHQFIEAYFNSDKGIGYTLARTHINSCDFSTESYTYVKDGDKNLKTFDINQDKKYRIPFIKKAIAEAGGKLTLYVSPWSPPAFMKTNNNMLQGGKLKPEFYQSWANYYAKFIKAYQKEGIPIWGLTIQNEPLATQRWESCIYTANEERDFLKNFLGPTLEKEGLGDKNIIVWDHNRDLLFQRANTILSDPEAAKYAWGTGFHWYEDWKDGKPMFKAVQSVNEAFPDKKLLFTEGCNESYDLSRIENSDPKLAERYGKSMINDFNNGTVGWTDWNILLNQNGGPNHVGNYCFSPVHANTETGKLTFTYSYYYLGHFSKFIKKGAKRISSFSSANNLLTTAFINPDNSIVVITMNQGDKGLNYNLNIQDKMAVQSIPAHAIQTVILK
jgi:glucosylceramidase